MPTMCRLLGYRGQMKCFIGLVSITFGISIGIQLHQSARRIFSKNIQSHIKLWSQRSESVRPDSCDGCFGNEFTVLIDQPRLCSSDLFILIIIHCKADSIAKRVAIRETWGSPCYRPDSNIKCLFVFGNTRNTTENSILLQESAKYHDILQFDFIDVYRNVTFKLVSEFQWVSSRCKTASYILKVDEDMYINIDLVPILLQAAPDEHFIGGKCWGPDPARRDNGSKWRVSFEEYPNTLYPPMCSGCGYVISGDLVQKVADVSKDVPFFWIDDVYLGLCLEKLNTEPVYLRGFYFDFVDFKPCIYRNKIITSHGLTSETLYTFWRESRRCELKPLKPNDIYRTLPLIALH